MDWDLYLDDDLSGPLNMARDEHLLQRAIATGRPSLRLYGWERLTLSLGRAQKLDRRMDLAACHALGLPMVRRSTGGRAVLHGQDLTYAVAAPLAASSGVSAPGAGDRSGPSGLPFGGGVLSTYRAISDVLVAFFRGLGHEPRVQAYAGRERVALASPNCFATPSAFEILIDGKKLVGSAQRRRAEGFLQHGSIPLLPQHVVLGRIYAQPSAAIRAQMTDLESMGVLQRHNPTALRERLVQTFAQVLGASFTLAHWNHADAQALQAGLARFPLLWGPHYAEPAPTTHSAPAVGLPHAEAVTRG